MKFKFLGEEALRFPLIGVVKPGDIIETEVEKIIKLLLGNHVFFEAEGAEPIVEVEKECPNAKAKVEEKEEEGE